MNRKSAISVLLFFLIIAFGLVSLLVILTRRHPSLVKSKLKLGAIILSLSGVASGCFTTTCYALPPENQFAIDQVSGPGDTIIVTTPALDTISGKITHRNGDKFSYSVTDSLDNTIKKEDIFPLDGKYDENTEEFRIVLGEDFAPGNYKLRFYTASKDNIDRSDWNEQYNLRVSP
ncbi:MAG TPA: hypothetical protein PLE24_09135 [Chitinispirillaceae bacterium]|jgi:hypothetical protein|nr:hypothetical protein [Chitinispirillaceae bacterium]